MLATTAPRKTKESAWNTRWTIEGRDEFMRALGLVRIGFGGPTWVLCASARKVERAHKGRALARPLRICSE